MSYGLHNFKSKLSSYTDLYVLSDDDSLSLSNYSTDNAETFFLLHKPEISSFFPLLPIAHYPLVPPEICFSPSLHLT